MTTLAVLGAFDGGDLSPVRSRVAGLSPAKYALLQRMLERRAATPPRAAIPKRPSGERAPLSFSQEILWFLHRIAPGSTAYNVPRAVHLEGSLDLGALQGALDAIVARHEILRTTYAEIDGAPAQIVHPARPVAMRVTDLRDLPLPQRELEARRLLVEGARHPFDLAADPMLRADVLALGPESHALLLVSHHIASDGWSKAILFHELAELYDAHLEGRPATLAALPVQYADYASWQRRSSPDELLAAQVAYWKNELAGAPALIELPTDRPRPSVQTYRGSHEAFSVPRPVVDALSALAREEGATLFMVLLAAFDVLLHRYTGQEDVVVGTPVAGRGCRDVEGLIGFFTNTLVLRADCAGRPTFRELLSRVRRSALGAYEHQDLPFEKLVEALNPTRALSHAPLFQVMLVLQNQPPVERQPRGLTMTPLKVERGNAKFDLLLSLVEEPNGISGSFEYATDLFDATTIARLSRHYQRLLESAAEDPERRIGQMAMLDEAERHRIVVEWNRTERPERGERCLHQPVEEQARRAPDRIAVATADGGQALAYGELDARAEQLARYLRARGVGPEVIVGISVPRSPEMVVGLLGILKAGGACMPLDPSYPAERLAQMIGQARCPFVLTLDAVAHVLPPCGPELIRLDTGWVDIARARADAAPEAGVRAGDLGYVLFTSGSTGRPKGVLLHHRGLASFCASAVEGYGLVPEDRVLQFASMGFDAHIEEIFPALSVGATVVLRDDAMLAGARFTEAVEALGITVLDLPTAYWHEWLRDLVARGARVPPRVRALIVGGEQASPAAYAAWLDVPGARRVRWINTAAPTECTVVSVLHEGDPSKPVPDELPIGRPMGNTASYVLDADLSPVPVGVVGEWVIGGAGVARGYLDAPELTAASFVPDPWSRAPGARLYRTRDRARLLPSGDVVLMGRMDHQVKLRGFRIELGEIEAALAQHPAVRDAVVVAREDGRDKRLVAYVVPGDAPPASELVTFLRERLPEFMIPAAFVALDGLPLTANGKVDRKALPAPDPATSSTDAFVPPRDAVEEKLARIWAEVLGVPRVGARDGFFDLGGHSLLAVRMLSAVEAAFGRRLPVHLLFESQTLERVAAHLRDQEAARPSWPALVPIQPQGGHHPLFCVSRPNVNALGYIALARHLGPSQPVYGLQSQIRDESQGPYERAELVALAERYLVEMRAAQPRGPYFLCGLCEGALIAFEMARLLGEQGDAVGLLGILDAWPIENTRRFLPTLLEMYHHRAQRRLRKLSELRGPARAQEAKGVLVSAATTVAESARSLLSTRRVAEKSVRGDGAPVLERFRRRYWPGPDFVPTPVACRITVFRVPYQPYWRIADRELGWAAWTTQGVEVHHLPGKHATILREPHVRPLAAALRACLAQAGIARVAAPEP